MTPITLFKFTYIPFEKGPIRSAHFFIVAENRKMAELIALVNCPKFLDESHTVDVEEIIQGFEQ